MVQNIFSTKWKIKTYTTQIPSIMHEMVGKQGRVYPVTGVGMYNNTIQKNEVFDIANDSCSTYFNVVSTYHECSYENGHMHFVGTVQEQVRSMTCFTDIEGMLRY